VRLSFLSAYQENVLGLFAVNGVYIATCFVVQQLVSDGVWPRARARALKEVYRICLFAGMKDEHIAREIRELATR